MAAAEGREQIADDWNRQMPDVAEGMPLNWRDAR